MRQAYEYQARASNSTTDLATGISTAAPALRYDNPNPQGAPYVKWDGYQTLPDGRTELIDRKTAISIFSTKDGRFVPPGLQDQLARQRTALAQNPGYKGVIEVPTEGVASEARDLMRRLNIDGIAVRVVPLRP